MLAVLDFICVPIEISPLVVCHEIDFVGMLNGLYVLPAVRRKKIKKKQLWPH